MQDRTPNLSKEVKSCIGWDFRGVVFLNMFKSTLRRDEGKGGCDGVNQARCRQSFRSRQTVGCGVTASGGATGAAFGGAPTPVMTIGPAAGDGWSAAALADGAGGFGGIWASSSLSLSTKSRSTLGAGAFAEVADTWGICAEPQKPFFIRGKEI